ncbi:MAG: hypothetical protein ACHP7P_06655 [Terriglobales bacterium]
MPRTASEQRICLSKAGDDPNRQCAENILDVGLKLLSADDLKPTTPCPDSETFALYIQGKVDEETRRTISQHTAFCSECYREYLALADPEKIASDLAREEKADSA